MIREIASIGDKLELRKTFSTIDNIKRDICFTSQILDMTTEDTLSIAMPIIKGRLIPLSVNDKYEMSIYSKKGLYQCKIVITNRYKDSNIHILDVQVLTELEKNQRREFYRLECILDISYHCISEIETKLTEKFLRNDFSDETEKLEYNDKLEELKQVWYQGMVTDLSGGGARFSSDLLLEPGLIVNLVLNLPNGGLTKQVEIQGIVISSIKSLSHLGYYEHRVKFVDILEEARETIIKFIFEEERRLRKEGKGLK